MNKIKLISTLPHLRIAIRAIKKHKETVNEIMEEHEVSQAQQSEFNRSTNELLIDCWNKEREYQNIGDGHFVLEALPDHLEVVHRSMIAYRHNAGSKHIPAGNMIIIYDDLTEIIKYVDRRLNHDSLNADLQKQIMNDIAAVKQQEIGPAPYVVKFPTQGDGQ